MSRRRKRHRGVVLLLVLSLLVLFLLIGVTFLIVAGQFLKGATAQAKHGLRGADPKDQLDTVLYQLLRDTTIRSSLQGHSILDDLYGNDGPPALGVVTDAAPGAGGQLVQIAFTTAAPMPNERADYFNGRVLTMVGNFARGPDGGFGTAGSDDNGNGVVDDVGEAGWPGSDDYFVNASIWPGPDGVWGTSTGGTLGNGDDDDNGTPNDISEAGWPGSDDIRAKARSTRIVDFDPVAGIVTVEAFQSDSGAILVPGPGQAFLVNGQPFNGTGAGYDDGTFPGAPGTRNTDLSIVDLDGDGTADIPIALLPHFAAYPLPYGLPTAAAANLGGADESYDAVDYQNMFLAMVPPGAKTSDDIIPSFHRPALINYWQNYTYTDGSGGTRSLWLPQDDAPDQPSAAEFRRAVVFRPLPSDHPFFTGSNPAFANAQGTIYHPGPDGGWGNAGIDDDGDLVPDDPTNLAVEADEAGWPGSDDVDLLANGPWDVDNDNDGIPDSIWIDAGLPITSRPDGTLVKPLVAILVRDLDGLLNLNAHGSLAQDSDTYHETGDYNTLAGFTATDRFAGSTPGTPFTPTTPLPRGRGFGPGEIYLGHMFGGELSGILVGRYGWDGGASPSEPGLPGVNDLLSRIKTVGTPGNFAAAPSGYASPPDIWGHDVVALDYAGQPFTQFNGAPDPTLDDPYEIDLFHRGVVDPASPDQPYTLAELERLLRWNDADARSLPDRLLRLAPVAFNSGVRRRLVTTESRHIPTPNVLAPPEIRSNPDLCVHLYWNPGPDNQWGAAGVDDDSNSMIDDPAEAGYPGTDDYRIAPNIINLFRAKLIDHGIPRVVVDTHLAEMLPMLPFELRRGGLFDVNRWFGDGRDNNSNNVVDEPGESTSEPGWSGLGLPTAFDSAVFNHLNDDPHLSSSIYARQLYARHLFCLMMLLMDEDYVFPFLPDEEQRLKVDDGLSDPEVQQLKRELTVRRIAQWAINVVDFRDPDAIMTPFEYHLDPFNPEPGPDGQWGQAGVDDDSNGTTDDVSEYLWPGSDDKLPWFVDGDPATIEGDTDGVPATLEFGDRRIVWGCEYPDLLITETLAFHDRRVADTPHDDGEQQYRQKPGTSPPEEGDDDLDQLRIPQGSLFIELYCTANRPGSAPPGNELQLPQELYDGSGRLDLGRTVTDGTTTWPVWRIAIADHSTDPVGSPLQRSSSRPDTTSFDPADMSLVPGPNVPLNIERIVWFTNGITPTPPTDPNDPAIYYNRGPSPLLQPGHYALVGPRAVTYVGSRNVDPNPHPAVSQNQPAWQKIQLAPDVDVFEIDDDATVPGFTTDYSNLPPITSRPPLAIVCAADPPTPWPRYDDLAQDAPANLRAAGIGLSVSEPRPHVNYYPAPPPGSNFDFDGDGLPDGYDHNDPAQRDTTTEAFPDQPFDENASRPLGANPTLLKTGLKEDFKTAFLQRLANPLQPFNAATNPYITVDWMPVDLTVFNGEDNRPASYKLTEAWDSSDSSYDPNSTRLRFATRQRTQPLWRPASLAPQPTSPVTPDPHFFKHQLLYTLGYLNNTLGAFRTAPAAYVGDPASPFPWLTWNNRPFDTPLELMLVPTSSPSRLLYEFQSPAGAEDPYDANGVDADPTDDRAHAYTPFHHLLNFFMTLPGAAESPHFYRLFDYVETPSPFLGAQRWYNPAFFSADPAANELRPPFNRSSRFRDPGRVNINTVFDSAIWQGIAMGFPGTPPWGTLVTTRRGYGSSAGILEPNDALPTYFANPFRSAASADLAPLEVLEQDDPVQATLLRAHPDNPDAPLFIAPSAEPYNSTTENAYFHYQGLTRLGNLLTTHSNVFAIWITIGYFEALPNDPDGDGNLNIDAGHPEGYQYGQEAGIQTGTVERHRAFYIVDRSIPVAFQPGENHNVDDCILLRRLIE